MINILDLSVTRSKNEYLLHFKEEAGGIWKFVDQWAELLEGNICRVGTTKYKFMKLVRQSATKSGFTKEEDELKVDLQIQSMVSVEQTDKKCRICYSSRQSGQNLLISPCLCTGTMQWIHMKCLSQWAFQKKNGRSDSYFMQIKKSICQICKKNMTQTQIFQKMIAQVLTSEKILEPPYAVLSGTYVSEIREVLQNFILVSFARKTSWTIGRGEKYADLFDESDRSVSRLNSQICYKEGRLFIKDRQSKHGTGIRIQSPISLSNINPDECIIYRNMLLNINFGELTHKD